MHAAESQRSKTSFSDAAVANDKMENSQDLFEDTVIDEEAISQFLNDTLEEEITDRGESNEIASGRSSVGPLVIAEEDCSSTTPSTAFIPEDRNIRSELAHGPHGQPKSFGNIASNNIPISQVRNPAFIDRKRSYQDISMDRYNSGSTPMANSHVSSRHRSPPPSSPPPLPP